MVASLFQWLKEFRKKLYLYESVCIAGWTNFILFPLVIWGAGIRYKQSLTSPYIDNLI